MDGMQLGSHPFLATGLGPGGLCLRAIRGIPAAAPLILYCRGIEVGRLAPNTPLREGDAVEVPVERLPLVPLPAELRLASAAGGPDLVAPWRLDSAASAMSLLGPPAVQVEDLRLDHGVLRGTARERRNGLIEPVLFARINGTRARTVTAEPPVALPEGGCAFRFAVPIGAGDLTEAGLSVQLYLVGQDAPIATWCWTRGLGEAERRLAEVEGRIRDLEEELAAAQQAAQAALRRQLALQQERIDAFIAAASTLLIDRAAAVPGREDGALRELLAATGMAPAGFLAEDATAPQIRVAPEDGLFGTGWHRAEIYPSGAFRWMATRGVLLNPAPERPLAGLTLRICHLYRAAAPALTALLDEAPGSLSVTALGGGAFAVRILPAGEPRAVRLVRLSSITGGCPAEDGAGADPRVLSFAVSEVEYDYAD